jgi:hypothetical protein
MAAKRASIGAKSGPERPLIDERLIDEALEATFPASDPPFFVGGGAGPSPQPIAETQGIAAHEGRRTAKPDKH